MSDGDTGAAAAAAAVAKGPTTTGAARDTPPKTPDADDGGAGIAAQNAELSAEVLALKKEIEKLKNAQRKKDRKKTAIFKEAFAAIDADGSGELDFSEFAFACGVDEGQDDADLRRLFNLLDRDNSGAVALLELTRTLRTDDEARALALKYDTLREVVKPARKKKRGGSSRRNRKSKLPRKSKKKHGGSKRAKKSNREQLEEFRAKKAAEEGRRGTAHLPNIAEGGGGGSSVGLLTASKAHSWAVRARAMRRLKERQREQQGSAKEAGENS